MRKEARISTAVWRTDFTDLPLACQGLYWMLLSQPDVSMCGVLPYLPSRWEAMCGSEDIGKALSMLEDAGYLLVDRKTSEVLIRTFVKHDGVLRSPKTRAGMWKSWASVLSTAIRAKILELVNGQVKEALDEGWVEASDVEEASQNGVSDTPSGTAQEGVSDRASLARAPQPQPPPQPQPQSLGGKPPSRDELFEKVAEVCGIDWQAGLTKSERGEINNAVKQLRDIDATPDQIEGKARAYRRKWEKVDLTPSALVKHWSKVEATPPPSSAPVRQSEEFDDAAARFAALTGGEA